MINTKSLQTNLEGLNMKNAVIDIGTNTCDAIRLPDGRWEVVSGSRHALDTCLTSGAANATDPSRTPAQTETGNSSAIPD